MFRPKSNLIAALLENLLLAGAGIGITQVVNTLATFDIVRQLRAIPILHKLGR